MEFVKAKDLIDFGIWVNAMRFNPGGDALSDPVRQVAVDMLLRTHVAVTGLGLSFSVNKINQVIGLLALPHYQIPGLKADLEELEGRIREELDLKLFRQVPTERANYYLEPKGMGGSHGCVSICQF